MSKIFFFKISKSKKKKLAIKIKLVTSLLEIEASMVYRVSNCPDLYTAFVFDRI